MASLSPRRSKDRANFQACKQTSPGAEQWGSENLSVKSFLKEEGGIVGGLSTRLPLPLFPPLSSSISSSEHHMGHEFWFHKLGFSEWKNLRQIGSLWAEKKSSQTEKTKRRDRAREDLNSRTSTVEGPSFSYSVRQREIRDRKASSSEYFLIAAEERTQKPSREASSEGGVRPRSLLNLRRVLFLLACLPSPTSRATSPPSEITNKPQAR